MDSNPQHREALIGAFRLVSVIEAKKDLDQASAFDLALESRIVDMYLEITETATLMDEADRRLHSVRTNS
jgi:hypothetical protein